MLPPLVFTLGPDVRKLEYKIPAVDFLFPDEDKSKTHICHFGVHGQTFVDMDYWVFGGAFL